MCLILFALDSHPDYRLVLAANRDEFFRRPTAPAAFWDDAPQLLAGRDLQSGGTWLGITTDGRFAAITNYRDPASYRREAPSRGRLVSDFLRGAMAPSVYLAQLHEEGSGYNGFNLIFGDSARLCCFSNRASLPPAIPPGIHGLSNHLLDTPWPKVSSGREALQRVLNALPPLDPKALFALLADRNIPSDRLLPDTGVGIERERLLAPLFIDTPDYGTRSSTLLLIDRENRVTFLERTFNGRPEEPHTVRRSFRIGQE